MGKNRKLDTAHHAGGIAQTVTIAIVLLVSSCSFPRIVILEDPLTPEEHLNLGVAYEKKDDFDLAIREYELASDKLPVAFLYLGNVYFQRGELIRAEEFYRRAIEADPLNGDAYNNLAWLYYTRGESLEEGEKLVLKALELTPSKEHIYRDTLERIREGKGRNQDSGFRGNDRYEGVIEE